MKRDAFKTLRAALERIANEEPREPEYDDWGGDTERAETWGQRCGMFEAGRQIRAALEGYDWAPAELDDTARTLAEAVEHVLIASEDGGDMNDIDWNMLRAALAVYNGQDRAAGPDFAGFARLVAEGYRDIAPKSCADFVEHLARCCAAYGVDLDTL